MRLDSFNLPIKDPLCLHYFWVSIAMQFGKEHAQIAAFHENSFKSRKKNLKKATRIDFNFPKFVKTWPKFLT